MFRIIVATLLTLATTAWVAQAGPYIGAGINYSQIEDASDGGVSLEGVFGFGIGRSLRAEAAVGYDTAEDSNLDIDLWTFFGNLYFDFNNDGRLTPYILGGLGYSTVKVEDSRSNGSLAGQLGAGLGFNLTESLILELKYRYMISEEYLDRFSINTHNVGLGVRFHF